VFAGWVCEKYPCHLALGNTRIVALASGVNTQSK
jgi:hypothetical protein